MTQSGEVTRSGESHFEALELEALNYFTGIRALVEYLCSSSGIEVDDQISIAYNVPTGYMLKIFRKSGPVTVERSGRWGEIETEFSATAEAPFRASYVSTIISRGKQTRLLLGVNERDYGLDTADDIYMSFEIEDAKFLAEGGLEDYVIEVEALDNSTEWWSKYGNQK